MSARPPAGWSLIRRVVPAWVVTPEMVTHGPLQRVRDLACCPFLARRAYQSASRFPSGQEGAFAATDVKSGRSRGSYLAIKYNYIIILQDIGQRGESTLLP